MTAGFALATLLVAIAIGLEPLAELFAWSSAVGTLGVLLLQAATSLAVFLYFRGSPDTSSIWSTIVAPLVALAALLFAVYLAVANFDAFTGGSKSESFLLMLFVPFAILFGLVVALVMRHRRPDMYREVGADMV